MRVYALIAVLGFSTATLAADPTPAATVTTMRDGREATQTGRTATVLQGVALATFGTGQLEAKVGKKDWEAALKINHIRVQFDKPQVIVLNVMIGDFRGEKSYSVSEFLVPTAVSAGSPIARVGDEYYSFGKWDPRILLLLKSAVDVGQ
jgi:hypothetical protein